MSDRRSDKKLKYKKIVRKNRPAACHDILDKSARALATFLFLEARAVALRLGKLTNAVVSSPDSSGFEMHAQSFSETHDEL